MLLHHFQIQPFCLLLGRPRSGSKTAGTTANSQFRPSFRALPRVSQPCSTREGCCSRCSPDVPRLTRAFPTLWSRLAAFKENLPLPGATGTLFERRLEKLDGDLSAHQPVLWYLIKPHSCLQAALPTPGSPGCNLGWRTEVGPTTSHHSL